jgi:hypothetical protein
MKVQLILLLAFCCPALGQVSRPQLRWTVNLPESHGLQSFERPGFPQWLRQQGVVFITPDRLAVYQVNKRVSPTPLGRRDVNGGAGNFFLDLKILDAHNGHAIKSLRFPTNASFSQVVPGRNGNFIVRTGDIIYLVSPDSKILASKPLSLERVAPFESWLMDAPPSHAHVVLVHQQIFIHAVVLADGTIASPGKSKTDIELLDPDTLNVIKKLSVSNYLLRWSIGDRFLVGTHPTRPSHAEEFGILDFEGHWKNLNENFQGWQRCSPVMEALDHELIAAYGCDGIVVLTESGHRIFSAQVRPNELPISVVNSGNYLVVQFASQPSPVYTKLQPLHMNLYDLTRSADLISIPLEKTVVYCDVSEQGSLVVLEGTTLRMFAAGNF